MRKKSEVIILMGTYNGKNFVREQIESIQTQSHNHWKLLIRDDGSSDATLDIVREMAEEDERIIVTDNDHKKLGASANFSQLAHIAYRMGAQYFCFADQDDVWQPRKLETQLHLMAKSESCRNIVTPTLLHSDLIIVDKNLGVINPSYMRFRKIRNESHNPIRVLLVQNFVTGCTVMANRPLIDLALPIPEGAVMHDWWLALCAAVWGRIDFLTEPTVLYRQHGSNEIGAKGFWYGFSPIHTNLSERLQVGAANFLRIIEQAQALKDRILCQQWPARVSAAHTTFQFASLWKNEPSSIKRTIKLNSLKIHRQNIFAQILLILRSLLTV